LQRAAVLLAVTILGALPVWIRPGWHGTEGRRVQIALEMIRSGDWMVPTLGGMPTFAKPPLHYWMLGAVIQWFELHAWTTRLPAVVLTFAAALLASALLRPWFGRTAAWTAALGCALSPLVLFEFPSAEIDPAFACLTAMSLWTLATGVARERPALVVVSGVLGGLALLQKGPPFFLFAIGAYLVWWRRRSLRFALAHFVPLVLVVACWFVPLLYLVEPKAMLTVAGEESVGRIAFFEWQHFAKIPDFWLRAIAVQAPLVFWCFWEWRGPRDARMDASDLTLRMCSGAAVVAVALLTLFPGRPTRYLLPNVLLFTFAVAPAAAHYAHQRGRIGPTVQRLLWLTSLGGAAALLVLPFAEFGWTAPSALALCIALGWFCVRSPRQVVGYCLVLPLIGAWTIGLERSWAWPDHRRAQEPAGRILRRELDRLGASTALATHGHVEAPLLLGSGLLPTGDETSRTDPTAPWILLEAQSADARLPTDYVQRLRLCLPEKSFVVAERDPSPR